MLHFSQHCEIQKFRLQHRDGERNGNILWIFTSIEFDVKLISLTRWRETGSYSTSFSTSKSRSQTRPLKLKQPLCFHYDIKNFLSANPRVNPSGKPPQRCVKLQSTSRLLRPFATNRAPLNWRMKVVWARPTQARPTRSRLSPLPSRLDWWREAKKKIIRHRSYR